MRQIQHDFAANSDARSVAIVQRSFSVEVFAALKKEGASTPVADIYARRFTNVEQARKSYRASLIELSNISEMKDASGAADLIADIIMAGGRLAFSTDYDSDGCSASAIITRFAREGGFEDQFRIFTPNRLKEGYGVNRRIVVDAIAWGADVLITADNGIAAFDAAEAAAAFDLPLIITDHHLPAETLPKATFIVNPARKDCGYMDGVLCGAAVIYLVLAMVKKNLIEKGFKQAERIDMRRMLQIVAAATVADCVPLVGINRAIVRGGLKMLKRNPYAGYREFIVAAGIDPSALNEETIGFNIGPVINAAGRLGDAAPSIDFLCEDDQEKARNHARALTALNELRKEVQADVQASAEKAAQAFLERHPDSPVIFIGNPSWHQGVVGIIASRLADKFRMPVFVFGGDDKDETILKGSGRSGDVNLHLKDFLDELFQSASNAIVCYGGHAKAAGLTIRRNCLDDIIREAVAICQGKKKEMLSAPYLVDVHLHSEPTLKQLEFIFGWLQAEPFGVGFPAPSVAVDVDFLVPASFVGTNSVSFSISDRRINCIAFGKAEMVRHSEGKPATLIMRPNYNYFRGSKRRQFIVEHILVR